MKKEKRLITTTMEVRSENDKDKITGYGARFNELSEVLFFFREKIAPGAFKDALKTSDVRALINHNPNYVLGRSKSGTLNLVEDEMGLRYEIDPPETSFAKDLLVSIKRGDITQSSFAFTVSKDNESWDESGDIPIRTIHKFDELFDVSPVTYPAYESTSVGARSMVDVGIDEGLDIPSLNVVLMKAKRGLVFTKSDRDLLNTSVQLLQDLSSDGANDTKDLEQMHQYRNKLNKLILGGY